MDVLVPVDGSKSTRKTVEHAVRTFPDASITVLHVLLPNTSYSAGMGGTYMPGLVIDSQEEYTDELFTAAAETAAEHGTVVTANTAVGGPLREILSFAAETDVDHIVLGSCGRTGVRRILFGNVTQGVVRKASVPVTVVN
jgi:nucleotide-binding universal stress UspA family protein